ncbi:ethanolamine ammonia-lyase subunit EutC [Amphritea sp. 1_MG-2023]|uniref:ethanolamine ammonia-lyase subunit EutC n=1 Tax=Amphritea sp. 1_MG-2023 TaxID=3062670 RepID=UPI0026E2F6B1|nr:ethanolamine ammonia-lyase subunit EutC [Amphritea sp. 1_MG-2023]MDO6564985.1 ethanolamine ammonia-lyase subunit EutC [Amphritea sp. 1_MG-2023]
MKTPQKIQQQSIVNENPWQALRRYTDARIAQGRAGVSVPTEALLAFQMDHASARDAVHLALQVEPLVEQLQTAGYETLRLHSQAADRSEYLQRPDLGRRLSSASANTLQTYRQQHPQACSVALVIADGLSSMAVQQHAVAMADAVLGRLKNRGLSVAPVTLVTQGRVAVGDEIGERLGAELLILLVGERPGLSSPDSLGIYYTYQPRVGLTDAQRNCISNVRPAGMSITMATDKLIWLIDESMRLKCSGVTLKDQSVSAAKVNTHKNFLLP